jgi:cellulose synthase/poly-beta-1,6-N-acetylglucosamine synthase-like glycosyltransferase/peptidoglycan/xylan/chitin deacetylase (PgdA/CDA1 family)
VANRHGFRPPRAHWLLLVTLLLAMSGLLALNAVLAHTGAETVRPAGSTAAVPPAVRTGGPVIDAHGDPPVTLRPPDRTLALTFDDGPDPRWTPAILDTLTRYRVHATFFVTGAQAARHPGLVREILARGNEIGHHTATHVDLRTAGTVRTWLELRSTDLVLAYAAGVDTRLVRPPYSAEPDAVDDPAWAADKRLGESGRLVVLSSLDSEDWRRPGVDAIVANATPRDERGGVLLMHDSGGDRSQTVAALDKLLPALLARGWRIDAVSHAIGLPGTASPSGALERLGGVLLVGAVHAADVLAAVLRVLLLVCTGLAALRMLLLLVTALVHVRRSRGRPRPPVRAPVTVIVPAYNEETGIAATVRSILASRHAVRVIVVDDGSIDQTPAIVEERFARAGVRLIRQPNLGKAAALNTGLAAAGTELVVMVDGDTVVEPATVGRLAAHFADPAVGAVSGNAKVGNRRGLLGRWQHIEYVIGFNLDRRMYDVLRCMPTVPGAVGAFRRCAVLAAGGVGEDTLAEDTDLTMALQRAGWRVTYEERAIAWTEAPASLGQLWKQRYRWCYGTLQAVWKHRRAVLERGPAGLLGRRGLPYLLLFQVVLPVLAPVVDLAAVFAALTADTGTTLLIWLAFLALQAIPGIVAFRLDGERLAPLLALPVQQLVYRQLMYLVVLQSLATALSGIRLPWHKPHRHGLARV